MIFIDIMLIFVLIVMMVGMFLWGATNDGEVKVATIMLVLFLIGIIYIRGMYISDTSFEAGFREGQIEAIIGNQHYELQTQKDSTTDWVRIEK
jgi:ABC-type multidrug transport system permease subunit